MSAGDVHTSNCGHLWENTVEGRPSLTWAFPDEEQALRNGEFVAATLGKTVPRNDSQGFLCI